MLGFLSDLLAAGRVNHARCLVAMTQYDEAETLLLEAMPVLEMRFRASHPDRLEAVKILVDLYEATERPDEAARWREKLPHSG